MRHRQIPARRSMEENGVPDPIVALRTILGPAPSNAALQTLLDEAEGDAELAAANYLDRVAAHQPMQQGPPMKHCEHHCPWRSIPSHAIAMLQLSI